MTATARRSISSTSRSIIRGVNALATSRRYQWWRGGSMFRIDRRSWTSASSVWSGMNVAPSSLENVRQSWLTARTSACFVTAQNPRPSGSGCQYTGSSRRRRSNWSWGT
jgi:hypothetical protein